MNITKSFVDKIFKHGALLVLILILLDLLTYFYYPNTQIGAIFLATREQTPLTWVSVVLLFLIGLSCALIYHQTGKRIWYFLALVYFFFSMDDATYFHERFSAGIQELVPYLLRFPSYSWIILYFPLLIFGVVGILYFLWQDATPKEKRWLKFAIFLLGSAVFLDMLDGFIGKDPSLVFCLESQCNLRVTHIARLVEETIEVFGFGILSYLSLIEHHKKSSRIEQ